MRIAPTSVAVYFIRNPETRSVKIGWSEDPESRLRTLQTANEVELILEAVLPGSESTERSLQDRWSDYHIRGEWYASNDELEDFIRSVNVVSGVLEAGPEGIQTLAWFLTGQWAGQDARDAWMMAWLRNVGGSHIEPEVLPLPSRKHLNQVIRYFALK